MKERARAQKRKINNSETQNLSWRAKTQEREMNNKENNFSEEEVNDFSSIAGKKLFLTRVSLYPFGVAYDKDNRSAIGKKKVEEKLEKFGVSAQQDYTLQANLSDEDYFLEVDTNKCFLLRRGTEVIEEGVINSRDPNPASGDLDTRTLYGSGHDGFDYSFHIYRVED